MLSPIPSPVFDRALRGRRSIRAFAARPVAKDTIEEMLDVARWAPSAHNAQPWRLAVLTTAESKEGLALAMGERWRQDLQADGISRLAIDTRTTQSYKRIVGAPVVLIVCLAMEGMDRYSDTFRRTVEYTLAAQSIGAFVQTLLLAAHGRGLGAGWMCAPAFCPDIVQASLRLPDGWQPQAMVLLGYPAEEPSPPPRREIAEFVVYR